MEIEIPNPTIDWRKHLDTIDYPGQLNKAKTKQDRVRIIIQASDFLQTCPKIPVGDPTHAKYRNWRYKGQLIKECLAVCFEGNIDEFTKETATITVRSFRCCKGIDH